MGVSSDWEGLCDADKDIQNISSGAGDMSFKSDVKVQAIRERIDKAALFDASVPTCTKGSGDNLLLNHNSLSMDDWTSMGVGESVFILSVQTAEHAAPGRSTALMRSFGVSNTKKGLYQSTGRLPVGLYTFSAYVMPYVNIAGIMESPGVYLQVVDAGEHVLCESAHLNVHTKKYNRMSCSFKLEKAQSVRIRILMDGLGTVYITAPQLESGSICSAYNLLTNGNFENKETAWCIHGGGVTTYMKYNMSSALVLGGGEGEAFAAQTVPDKLSENERAVYTLSGRAKIPNTQPDLLSSSRLLARIYYSDDTFEEHGTSFIKDIDTWQFAAVRFTKSRYKAVQKIAVICQHVGAHKWTYFDNIRLVRNHFEEGLNASDFAEDEISADRKK